MNHSISDLVSKLSVIGLSLTDEISPSFINAIELLHTCERQPGLDITLGSIASISYRLCEALKTTANLGYGIHKAIDDNLASKPVSVTLDILRKIHHETDHLIDGNLVFLGCDIDTLLGHPELEKAIEASQKLALIQDQLLKIEEKVYSLGLEANTLLTSNLSTLQKLDQSSLDSSWKLVQQLINDCTAIANQTRNRGSKARIPTVHPKPRKGGEPCIIQTPDIPSDKRTWYNRNSTAIFVPGGKSPPELHGIPMNVWTDQPNTDREWNAIESLAPIIDEPPPPKTSLPLASGVVTVEPDGRFWLVSPTNQYGGYETTFPKGKLEGRKLSLQANAIKEAVEESGLRVSLTGYLGDFKRTSSMTRLYLARRTGGDPCDMGWESQAVRLVPLSDLALWLTASSDKLVLETILSKFGH